MTAPSPQSMPLTSLILVRMVWRLLPAHCRAHVMVTRGKRDWRSAVERVSGEERRDRVLASEKVILWLSAERWGMGPWFLS